MKKGWEHWPEARQALREALYGDGEEISHGVRIGRMELFRVNDDSWAVTERMRGMLFIWCYAGRGAVQFVHRMQLVAKANGMSQVSFFSRRKGAARAWRRFHPQQLATSIDGERQYVFEVSA